MDNGIGALAFDRVRKHGIAFNPFTSAKEGAGTERGRETEVITISIPKECTYRMHQFVLGDKRNAVKFVLCRCFQLFWVNEITKNGNVSISQTTLRILYISLVERN